MRSPPICGDDILLRYVSFGLERYDAVTGITYIHEGTDFFAPEGTELLSVDDCVIDRIGFARDGKPGGNRVRLYCPESREHYYYAHMLQPPLYTVGDELLTGDIVGWVGRTGAARDTSAHLHFEPFNWRGERYNIFKTIMRLIEQPENLNEYRGPIECPTIEGYVLPALPAPEARA